MQLRSHIIVFAALVLGLVAATAAQAATYPVYKLTSAPVMDGKVDGDPAWSGVPSGTGFHVLGGRRLARKQTFFKMGFTDDALYIGVRCEEPDIAKVNTLVPGSRWPPNALSGVAMVMCAWIFPFMM